MLRSIEPSEGISVKDISECHWRPVYLVSDGAPSCLGSSCARPIHGAALVTPPLPFTDVIAVRAELRLVCELIEGGGELIGVSMSLLDSPFFERVQPDAFKIARRCRG